MRWPFTRRTQASPSPDAEAAVAQAHRALADAQNLDQKVERVTREAEEIRRTNHIGAAVLRSIRGV